jgi:hypothetical protein
MLGLGLALSLPTQRLRAEREIQPIIADALDWLQLRTLIDLAFLFTFKVLYEL